MCLIKYDCNECPGRLESFMCCHRRRTPYARGPRQTLPPTKKQTLQTLTTDLRVCNNRRSRLGVLERSLPRGLRARTHWRCTGGVLLGAFSLRVSGSAELSALYQNSLRSRAVDLGAPALEFASAFGWKTNSECDMQLMQSGRIV